MSILRPFGQHNRAQWAQRIPRIPRIPRNQVNQVNQTNQTNSVNQRSAFSNVPDELISLIKALGSTYKQGVKAETTAQFVREAFSRFADPTVQVPLMTALSLAAEGFMRGGQYDARAAIAPAGQVIQAVQAIQSTSDAVRAWAEMPPRKTVFDWFRPGVFWAIQKQTLKRKVATLESTLESAAEACDYAGSQIRQQYNLLNLLIPATWDTQAAASPAGTAAGTAADAPHPESSFPVPAAGFRTPREQITTMRVFVGAFAGNLSAAAGESASLINATRTSDGTGVNPVTVQAQGRSLAKVVLAGLVTCRELEDLLDRPLAARSTRQQRQPTQRKRQRDDTGKHAMAQEQANSQDDGEWRPTQPAA